MPSSVKIARTAYGIVRRLVVNCVLISYTIYYREADGHLTGLKPSSRRVRVRYVPGGDCGIYAIKPRAYSYISVSCV